MKKFQVTYMVRQVGAIGIFWPMTDIVEADSYATAPDAFRAKYGQTHEFLHTVRVGLVGV